ncbi:MAG: aminotransferase class V-fold PLP-dependent enzyme [Myxococcales bacterium]|nr:aminotransferase class V-fold PLP-dependent enzyme [Myxococcales bacterium]
MVASSTGEPASSTARLVAERSRHADAWTLDPSIRFLNHGSFGACPRAVLSAQAALREQLERQPLRFLYRELEGRLDHARERLADFVGARARDLAFVTNASAGVNTVLRALELEPGDELLVTDHEYNATRNAAEFAARRAGARVRVARLPFPLRDPDELCARVLEAVGPRTRLAVLDHVTSQTGLVVPVERLVPQLRERGVETLVDGAHAPGMLALALDELGAGYYTGNAHKWLCTPKGAAFLHVREDLQERTPPLVISHGANSPRVDRGRFQLLHDWTGTCDPTPWLVIPDALAFMGSRLEGGWAALRAHNHALCLQGRARLCAALEIPEPAPASMIGSIASVPLPDGDARSLRPPLYVDPLQDALLERHGIEVPVIPWPAPPRRLLRISAQLYNGLGEYEALASALRGELAREAASAR